MGTYISRVSSLHSPCSNSNVSQPIKYTLEKSSILQARGYLFPQSASCPDAKNHCLLQGWPTPPEHMFVVFVLPWPNFLGVIVYRQLCLWFFVYILMLIGYKSCIHLILILFISVWFAKMFRICVHRDISLFCNVFVSFWNRCNADFIEWVGMLPIFWKSYVELILFLFS